MIISRTPLRISLFGGGTDYPGYYKRKKGAVLGMSIDKYVYISLNPLSHLFEHKIRIGYSKAEWVKTIEEIQHPSIRACLSFKNMNHPLDIHVFSDLPARTGLGSSSAFTVGFLHALDALEGKRKSKDKLIQDAVFIEHQVLCEDVGAQDPCHVAHGGINTVLFQEKELKIRPVIVPKQKRETFENHLLLLYTGQARQSKTTGPFPSASDEHLDRMANQVAQAEELFSADCRQIEWMAHLGLLLHDAWELKKRLSPDISTSRIDEIYSAARHAGAYGGKLCGAGGGGFLVLLAPPDTHYAIQRALPECTLVPCKPEEEGSTIIYMRP